MSDRTLFRRLVDGRNDRDIEKRSQEAMQWYRDAVGRLNRNELLDSEEYTKERQRPTVGQMYMFRYDPKTKDKLPFYDRFPVIFMVGPAKPKGFYGLNLHYLHPRQRAIFFLKLTELTNNAKSERERLVLSYQLLKGASALREFKPCFKHYLPNHLISRLAFLHPKVWDIACMIPSEQFVKASRNEVWNNSRDQI